MITLTLIRGLPGSGKTTLAQTLGCVVHSADDWMCDGDGNYAFDPRNLSFAHDSCQAAVWQTLGAGLPCAVANTFSQEWEIKPYRWIAAKCGATVKIIDLFDAGLTDVELAARNIHGVSGATIAQMRARWER